MENEKYTALYLRVSTVHQSSDSQRHALLEYCKSNNITNYRIFADEGISGTKSNRPQLNEMMNKARSGDIDTVIVFAFSRMARNVSHLSSVLDEFNKLEISFISITENIDTSTTMGRALYLLISVISSMERDLLSERIRAGINNARAKGKNFGRPRTRNSSLIRELAKKGMSYREIAKLANCSVATVHRELASTEKIAS